MKIFKIEVENGLKKQFYPALGKQFWGVNMLLICFTFGKNFYLEYALHPYALHPYALKQNYSKFLRSGQG